LDFLNKYEILSELGRGAMGAVYKARDPLINRLVALKTITTGPNPQANLIERFYQEARSAGALQHPNIITIYELGTEKNTPFIAMEYLEGESLDRLIEQRPALPLSVKLGYIVKVCDALAYAHQHNVVHRDIKPANVVVTRDGVVKVVDFGIARLADMTMTQPNMMLGSRAYMSPELYKGERADARSDIWAVGVTLYELLSYRRPFVAENEAELMFHILHDPPPDLHALSPECTADLLPIVEKMLHKNIDERYQSMEEVLHHLEPVWRAAQQSTVSGLLSDCRALVDAQDLPRAQVLLRKALEIDVGNTQAKSLLEKVTTELRRTQILPRIQEHLSRGAEFLRSGHFREARAEGQSALGLDSKNEPAQKLVAEAEAAVARLQQVEQKLRLTKQRLAEGALTEAASALQQAIEIDEVNPQARELKKQIADETARREKRKKLSEILHKARSLWTALNYEECLSTLDAALREFPNEPELLKLRETANTDQLDHRKQEHLGEVRKLLARQEFLEARKKLDRLLHDHPQDTAVLYLKNLVVQQEEEEKRQKRLVVELASLRALLAQEKFKQLVARGEVLLQEYPQEFELTEMVNYARGEVALQDQLRRQEELEKQLQAFLNTERFAEALDTARRAVQDFPQHDALRKLLARAEAAKSEQDAREHARAETQRRIHEMNSMLKQDKITDAIDLGQQTLEALGPDPNITQIIHGAELRRTHKETSQPAPPLEEKSPKSSVKQPATPLPVASVPAKSAPRKKDVPPAIPQLAAHPPAASIPSPPQTTPQPSPAVPLTTPAPPAVPTAVFAAPPKPPAPVPSRVTQASRPLFLRPPILAAIAIVVAALVVFAVWSRTKRRHSGDQQALAQEATQLWQQRKFDDSEQLWREASQIKGPLTRQAADQVHDIDQKRAEEQRLFDQAEALLKEQKDYAHAAQGFQDVIDLNLWHVDDATRELGAAQAALSATDIHTQEQALFASATQFFQSGDYAKAAKDFKSMLALNVPDSTLAPQANDYLAKIRTLSGEQKVYDGALEAIKHEDWGPAREQLQTVIARKAPQAAEAKRRLSEVQSALQALDSIEGFIHEGSYHTAKNQIDALQQWPRTRENLTRELHAAQQQQFDAIRAAAQSAEIRSDAAAIQHIQDDLHKFQSHAEDASLLAQAKDFEKHLDAAFTSAAEKATDKSIFDAAVSHFEQARQKKDLDKMHAVTQEFQKIANGTGTYHEQAAVYIKSTIPDAIQAIDQASGKATVPAIACGPSSVPIAVPSGSKALTCDKLDATPPLQWAGSFTVDFPDVASQAGKLPYTLYLYVTADESGNVKIDKQGNADKDFFKKAKDSSKHWKTTIPTSQGKPVSVRFPITITFQH
jgi:serine/threonine-protein kinase